jgi:hypothetical protein
MPRIDDLKKQHPQFNITYLDVIKRLDISKTGKYSPVISHMINEIIGKRITHKNEIDSVKSRCDEYGFDYKGLNDYELATSYTILDYIIGKDWETMREFMDYMERGVIENKDVLTYKNMEDIRGAVSTATLKLYSKELESQVHKEFEDDTWIAVRPLSFEASSKYGSSTKWCTTYKKEKEYFAKYFSRGVLVYFINKITGYKFALYSEVYELNNEISFWNAEDTRVDFLQLNIEPYLLPIIKNLAMSKIKNSDMLKYDELEKVYNDCDYHRSIPLSAVENPPQDEAEVALPLMAYAGDVVNLTLESVYVNPSVRRGLGLVNNESEENGENEVAAGDYIMYEYPNQDLQSAANDYISLTRG